MPLWLVFCGLLLLFAAPFLLERDRRPMEERARRKAPGKFVRLSDGITHYRWHGPATSRRTLVCVHGLTTPCWVFDGLIPGLTAMGFRVLTYDLYGRGFSDRPKGAQTPDFFLRQLQELLENQGIKDEISLMGYSMGGAIATAFAAKEPDRVARLILLAPAGIDYSPAWLLRWSREGGAIGDWLWGLLGARALRRGARADSKLPTVFPNLPTRIRAETRTQGYLRSILSAERNMLTLVQEAEHRELKAMFVATLAIWGEKDTVIPITSVGKLSQWNRDAHIVVVPGATHALGYTHPRDVIAAIAENLREE
jgi:pimeloyl-ACP methyl ester carboxylesterase